MVNCYPLIFKKRVIDLYKSQKYDNINDIIKIFQISKSSLYNWIKLDNNSRLREKRIYKKKPYLASDEIDYLKNYVIKRINFNIYKLREQFIKKYHKKISISKIYKLLAEKNVTYKKTINRNIHLKKKDYNKRLKEHKNKLKKIKDDEIVSIDETHFDNYINMNYGWGVKREKNKKRKIFAKEHKIFSNMRNK